MSEFARRTPVGACKSNYRGLLRSEIVAIGMQRYWSLRKVKRIKPYRMKITQHIPQLWTVILHYFASHLQQQCRLNIRLVWQRRSNFNGKLVTHAFAQLQCFAAYVFANAQCFFEVVLLYLGEQTNKFPSMHFKVILVSTNYCRACGGRRRTAISCLPADYQLVRS